jgi:phage-related holin
MDIWYFITTIFIAALMFLTPIKDFVHLIIALIIIDFITGIISSFKNDEKITAKRMVKTVYKLILYSVAIIATYLVQQIANDNIGVVRIAALFIAATELKSIYENISKVVGGDIFTQLWNILKSKIDDFIGNIKVTKGSNDEINNETSNPNN